MAHRRSAYGPGVLALNTWTKQMGEGLQGFQVVCLSLGRSVHGTKTFRCSDLRDQSAFSHRQNLVFYIAHSGTDKTPSSDPPRIGPRRGVAAHARRSDSRSLRQNCARTPTAHFGRAREVPQWPFRRGEGMLAPWGLTKPWRTCAHALWKHWPDRSPPSACC